MHNNLQKSFVLPSSSQMAEPSGALQGHFVRLRSISSRITSGPEDEVENFHAVFYGLELSIKLFVFALFTQVTD